MSENNALVRLAEAAGLPAFEERGAAVHASSTASTLLGARPLRSLAEAVALLTESTAEEAEAAVGASTELGLVRGWRLFADGAAGARTVLLLPPNEAEGARVLRRAAQADLAGHALHELANALTAIHGWVSIAVATPTRTPDALEHINESVRSARRVAEAILGGLSPRPSAPAARALEVAHDVVRVLEPIAARRGVRVEVDGTDGLADCGRDELWAILSNLVDNAIDASPRHARVVVRVSRTPAGVRLEVRDEGEGMDAPTRERALKPYFTTKPDGTGLGLPLVVRICEANGGSVRIETNAPRGTRVVVELPGTTPHLPDEADALKLDARILVVEDDPPLRELVATALTLRGADVTCASSGALALGTAGTFELAVIDMTLPDVRGDLLAAKLAEAGRLDAWLLVSGAPEPADLLDGPVTSWLRKPYDVAELEQAVHAVLVRARASRGASISSAK